MRIKRFVQYGAATILLASSCLASSDLRVLDAVKRRDQKALTTAIRQRADVNAAQPDGATALAWAAHLGAEEAAAPLPPPGRHVNVAEQHRWTPTHPACPNA